MARDTVQKYKKVANTIDPIRTLCCLTFSSEAAHEVLGNPYEFSVDYLGFFNPPAGYSIIHFSRYDYLVDVKGGNVRVASRYYKVGPKAK